MSEHQHGDDRDYLAMQVTIMKDPETGAFSARIKLATHLNECSTCRSVAIAQAVSIMGGLHHKLLEAEGYVATIEEDAAASSDHRH